MYRNLSAFLKALADRDDIITIDDPVSPCLDISRRTDAESKKPGGGKALFFKNVTGYRFPVATNIFGSNRRICMALGVDRLDDLAERIRTYIEFNPPRNIKEALNIIPMAVSVAAFFPRKVKTGAIPCQEIVYRGDQVDLGMLPVLHCWPKDAGPFVTLPLVFTRSRETGRRNVGMYRLQIFDRNTTGMHWHIHKDGSHYYNEYVQADQRMPVAVAIGCDPATTYAATAPMPRGVDEMLLAGFIRKKPVRMARCVTIDMEVPAEAEFVLEGYVDPGELRTEGPFGDHTGYYSLADEYPVFHVTAVTHRRHPVYSATLVGPPPMEDCYLAKATERLFLPMLQTVMPEIRDYFFPWEGVFHNIVIVSIDKAYAGHAHKVISGLWGQGQMSFCKTIVVVDHDVDPSDLARVMDLLVTRFDVQTDMVVTRGILDVLDHSSPHANFGNKIGIDLTKRVAGEPPRSDKSSPPSAADPDAVTRQLPTAVPEVVRCRAVRSRHAPDRHAALLVNVDKSGGQSGRRIAGALLDTPQAAGVDLFIMLDADIDPDNPSLVLWKVFNNTDPGRDIRIRDRRVVLDATRKGPADGHHREWPDELTFDGY